MADYTTTLAVRARPETEAQLQRIAELRTGNNRSRAFRVAVALAELILTDASTLAIAPEPEHAEAILDAYTRARCGDELGP